MARTFTLTFGTTPIRVAFIGSTPWISVSDFCAAAGLYMMPNGYANEPNGYANVSKACMTMAIGDTKLHRFPNSGRSSAVMTVAGMTEFSSRTNDDETVPFVTGWIINELEPLLRYSESVENSQAFSEAVQENVSLRRTLRIIREAAITVVGRSV